jgi:hypothetical protein
MCRGWEGNVRVTRQGTLSRQGQGVRTVQVVESSVDLKDKGPRSSGGLGSIGHGWGGPGMVE